MGLPENEQGRRPWEGEGPQNKVDLTEGLGFGAAPVTQRSREELIGPKFELL